MSKKKTKKKHSAQPVKKKKNVKPYLIAAGVALAAAAVTVAVYFIYMASSLEGADFAGKQYNSAEAFDASGDEVNLQEVYEVRYDSYQGSMTLKSDGTFSFWMTIGDPSDGTHSGTYTYNRAEEALDAVFDNGEKAIFKLVRDSDGAIKRIEAPYNGYTVYFTEQEP